MPILFVRNNGPRSLVTSARFARSLRTHSLIGIFDMHNLAQPPQPFARVPSIVRCCVYRLVTSQCMENIPVKSDVAHYSPSQMNTNEAMERPPQNRRAKMNSGKACDQCFRTKVRCGSEQPACAQCRKNNSSCTYSTSKKDTKARSTKKQASRRQESEQRSDESNTRSLGSSDNSIPEGLDRSTALVGNSRQQQVCIIHEHMLIWSLLTSIAPPHGNGC